MSDPTIVIISATIGAIVGPIILLLLNKLFSKPKDDTDMVQTMQQIANQAIDDLQLEKEASAQRDKKRSEEYNKVQERLRLVEQAAYGPYRIVIDFTTKPMGIQNQKIELLVVKDGEPKPS